MNSLFHCLSPLFRWLGLPYTVLNFSLPILSKNITIQNNINQISIEHPQKCPRYSYPHPAMEIMSAKR